MKYNLISGDGHIDLSWLPHDIFLSQAPLRWKDDVPRVVETKKGKRWFAEGRDLSVHRLPGNFGALAKVEPPVYGTSLRINRMYDAGLYDGEPHPTNPALRLKDQDIDGLDAEVIYGILAISRLLEDRRLLRLVYQMYNTWVSDFSKVAPDRLIALACIPNDDPSAAADEVRRAARLGLKGADFDVATAIKPIWHRDWDPLWRAADECQMPLSFHTTGMSVREPSDSRMATDYATQYKATQMTLFPIGGYEYLCSVIFSGALDRYPGMKFVLGECGASWIPYALDRMDMEYDDQFWHLNYSLKPSEFWYRQGYTTYQHETLLGSIAHLVTEANIIWGADYPHPDGVWPDSQQSIEKDLSGLRPEMIRTITCENARKLYGLVQS